MNELTPLLSSVLVGSASGLGAFAGRNLLGDAFAWIERDVGDKLRAQRIAPRSLRRLLVTWLATIGGIFVVLGIMLGSPLLALAICAILGALPWYVVRRLAEPVHAAHSPPGQPLLDELLDGAGAALGQAQKLAHFERGHSRSRSWQYASSALAVLRWMGTCLGLLNLPQRMTISWVVKSTSGRSRPSASPRRMPVTANSPISVSNVAACSGDSMDLAAAINWAISSSEYR